MLLSGGLTSALKSWASDRQLPGASAPVPAHGELLAFNSDVAAADALASLAGRSWQENGQAGVRNLTTYAGHGHAVVPFERRRSGDTYFIIAAGLTFDPAYGSREKAEMHYILEHTRIAARFPGCEGYIVGVVDNQTDNPNAPYRLAFSIYRDEQAHRSALSSPVARDLENDARGYAKVARLFFFDARVEI
jgi:uncharacterized protein (TIGR02118 family)